MGYNASPAVHHGCLCRNRSAKGHLSRYLALDYTDIYRQEEEQLASLRSQTPRTRETFTDTWKVVIEVQNQTLYDSLSPGTREEESSRKTPCQHLLEVPRSL